MKLKCLRNWWWARPMLRYEFRILICQFYVSPNRAYAKIVHTLYCNSYENWLAWMRTCCCELLISAKIHWPIVWEDRVNVSAFAVPAIHAQINQYMRIKLWKYRTQICGCWHSPYFDLQFTRVYLRSVEQMPKRLSRVRLKSNWFGYISVHVAARAWDIPNDNNHFVSKNYIFVLRLKCFAPSLEIDSNRYSSQITYLVVRWFVICIEWKESLPAVTAHYTRVLEWIFESYDDFIVVGHNEHGERSCECVWKGRKHDKKFSLRNNVENRNLFFFFN